ncbi:FadR family transcriptional regulator [Actinomadura graeca]|uniref:FadR family transcriptional regulator n=1 Tax=Actinomadura graeca TaxID=2750812 RepID=A0ABX8QTL7_9ACTN|nr:FCD domain-containing protein [Actinomadura graeca]QXJ21097.1 FadR family transcriptional regulator [Actinomadura graeca]
MNGVRETTDQKKTAATAASLRSRRVAEVVADRLRARILSGELGDGDRLPKEDDLRQEYPVSKQSIREAMRILEAEGLLTVMRGQQGGAILHTPQPARAAYALGLVLVRQKVPLDDLARAIRVLEPQCAEMCAARPTGKAAILKRLKGLQEQSIAAINDSIKFTDISRLFHEELVRSCGNQTMVILLGALESLWSAHVHQDVTGETERGVDRGPKSRQRSVEEHQRIIDMIKAGDPDGTRVAAEEHLARVQPRRTQGHDAHVGIAGLENVIAQSRTGFNGS